MLQMRPSIISWVRAATTASSLEAEQDSGNITKTRSKAAPNESSSLGTTSGGGPGCQETMGDTTARTRFESVSKHSNDSLLARDEEITLVSVQDDANKEMFDVDALNGEEMFVAGQNENVVEEVVDAAKISTAATTFTITTEEITLAQALKALKTSKPKDKAKFDEEERLAREKAEKEKEANISLIEEWDDIQAKIDADHQLVERLVEEKRNKPPTKAQQRQIMCTYLKNMEGYKLKDLKLKGFDSIQEMFNRAFRRQKVDDDKETSELKQCLEIIPDEEEVTINAIPLAVKSPRIVDWKIHKEGKKSYYQIIRADGKSQMYMVFSHMLKSFDREDLEDLYKLVKARYGSTRPVESMDYMLWNDMKIMFEPHVEDEVWKLQNGYQVLEWKLYESCGGRIVGIKSLLDAVWITAAHVCVNAA
ncbi:hypothetical protein Tco_0743015 [Tanacetum coccineum]